MAFMFIEFIFQFLDFSKIFLKLLITKLCPTLCNHMDRSPPGFFVHGILQARILEWVSIPFSRGSSQPRDQTQVSSIAHSFFTIWATQEVPKIFLVMLRETKEKVEVQTQVLGGKQHAMLQSLLNDVSG